MFFSQHLILFSIVLFPLTSLAMSIPTPADTAEAQSAGANTTSPLEFLNLKVDPARHPDWAGVMQLSDCKKAQYYFKGRVAFYNPKKPMTFWSRKWTVRPPGEEFELPFGMRWSKSRNLLPIQRPSLSCCIQTLTRYPLGLDLFMLNANRQTETCTLLLRMGKDFGNNVLPINREFADETEDLPAAMITWEDILDSMHDTLEHVEAVKFPDWTYAYGKEGPAAVVMFIPSSSVISRRWAPDIRAGLGNIVIGPHGSGRGVT
ncbi:MAG: hypothetical protein Q9221_007378 [Calogaya cf. arnoldii]